jgi:hypothetical protein
MNSANHIPQDDLYLFALQLLPEAEMLTVARHLESCELCCALVADVQGDMAAYALSADMKAPPSQARERLLRQVAKEKKIVPVRSAEAHVEPVSYSRNSRLFQMEEREPRRGMGFAGWAGWAIAAGLLVAGGWQFQQRQKLQIDLNDESAKVEQTTQSAAQTQQAQQVLQTLTDANAMQVSLHVPLTKRAPVKLDPEGHATYVPGKAALVFVASHLDPLQPAKTYELWLLPADAGAAPIPAGLFRPDANGNASVVMPTLPTGVAAKGFGVTIENEGGSQKPTAPIVLAGL